MKAIPTRHEIDPKLVGEELTRLINEAMERTGRDALSVIWGICNDTGVRFSIKDGKLTITKAKLRQLAPYLKAIREHCESLSVLPHKLPQPVFSTQRQKSEPSALSRLWEGFWEHPILYGAPLMAIFAVCMVNLAPPKPSTLESAELRARTGHGAEMTNAEADAFRRKQEADSASHRAIVTSIAEAQRSSASENERAVYRYMRRRFESLGSSYNPDIHDSVIADEAAQKFGITASEANSIYYRLDR